MHVSRPIWFITLVLAIPVISLLGCEVQNPLPPIKTENYVDLDRFSGAWYVIASNPTFIDKDAYDAVESYSAPRDGQIDTTFTFNEGSFDGKQKTYRPTGYVKDDGSNAVWGMQFVWPFQAEYRIVYIDEDYQYTIVGRSKRDFVWIMARNPDIADEDYARLTALVAELGYDLSKLRRIPHRTRD